MPSRLDKYELGRVVGRGAAGTVYEAWDTVLDRRVAIKVVRLSDADELRVEEMLMRYRQEAQVASRLSHQGVIGVHNYGEVEGVAFIDMEYVEGETLKTLLERSHRLPWREAVTIIRQMLLALDYCHGHRIVHRDIKPANIMLPAAGGVKLADFGIARIENSDLTIVGTILGTPAYMSPEQFAPDQSIGLQTDIWSTGVVLYEMLTGERPFSGDTLAKVRAEVTGKQLEPPSRRVANLPPALDQVLVRALRKSPADRFRSAGAFADALRDAMPNVSTPQPVGKAGKRFGTVSIGLIAGGMLATAGAAAWIVLGTPGWSGSEPTRSFARADHATPGPPQSDVGPSPATSPPKIALAPSPPVPAPDVVVTPQSPVPATQPPDGAPVPPPPAQTPSVLLDPPSPVPAPSGPTNHETTFIRPDPRSIGTELARIPCSSVAPANTNGLTVLRGVIGSGEPLAELDSIAATLPASTTQLAVQTFPRALPACEFAELVRANGGAESIGDMRLTTFDGRGHLFNHDEVRLRLHMPDFDGEIRVEDLTVEGRIAHLMDAVLGASPHRRAGEDVRLGRDGSDLIGYVNPPFGTELVVAIVSSQPLFKARRPQGELPAAFLSELGTAIAALRGRGGQVAMDALVVTTSARDANAMPEKRIAEPLR